MNTQKQHSYHIYWCVHKMKIMFAEISYFVAYVSIFLPQTSFQ